MFKFMPLTLNTAYIFRWRQKIYLFEPQVEKSSRLFSLVKIQVGKKIVFYDPRPKVLLGIFCELKLKFIVCIRYTVVGFFGKNLYA